jgi:outer membrane protein
MKVFFKIITLAIAMASISFAQAAEVQKIGVVFPSKVLNESPQRARIIKKLEAEFKDRIVVLQTLGQSIQELESKIKKDSELLSKEDQVSLKRQMEVKVSEYNLKRKAFEEDNRRRQNEEQEKASTLMRDVINEVAKKGNFDLILNGEQIIFAKPEWDISGQVIQEISTK